jgi:hypothetical protein
VAVEELEKLASKLLVGRELDLLGKREHVGLIELGDGPSFIR